MRRWLQSALLVLVSLCAGYVALADNPHLAESRVDVLPASEPGAVPDDQGVALLQQKTLTNFEATYIDLRDGYGRVDHSRETKLEIKRNERVILLRLDNICPMISATIQTAYLDMYVTGGGDQPIITEVYQICRPWMPAEANWYEPAWFHDWGLPGARLMGTCGDADQLPDTGDYVVASDGTTPLYETLRLDVTQVVQQWANDPNSNHGLLLRAGEGPFVYRSFASPQHPHEQWRPRLVVNYRDAQEIVPDTMGIVISPLTATACSGLPVTVDVTATGQYGCPVADGTWVQMTTTLGYFGEAQALATSVRVIDGVATALLLPGDVAGVATIEASCPGMTHTESLTLTIAAGPAAGYAFPGAGDREMGRPLPLRLASVDCGGTLTADHSCASVTMAITPTGSISPSVVSLADGVWEGSVTISDTVVGAEVFLTAEGCDLTGESAKFRILPPGPQRLVIACPNEIAACAALPITVTAVDQYGQPYTGFDATLDLGTTCASLEPAQERMFVDGIWSGEIIVRPNDAQPHCEILAESSYGARSITGSANVNLNALADRFTFTDANRTYSAWPFPSPTPQPVIHPRPGGDYEVVVTTQITDTCGFAFAGQVVGFSASAGYMDPGFAYTDEEGVAASMLRVNTNQLSLLTSVDVTAHTGLRDETHRVVLGSPCGFLPFVTLPSPTPSPTPPCPAELVRDGGFEGHVAGPRYWEESPDGLVCPRTGPMDEYDCLTENWVAKLTGHCDHLPSSQSISQDLGYVGACASLKISFDYVYWHLGDHASEFAVELIGSNSGSVWRRSVDPPSGNDPAACATYTTIPVIPVTSLGLTSDETLTLKLNFAVSGCDGDDPPRVLIDNVSVRGTP